MTVRADPHELDGDWVVHRESGLLPPLWGVRKHIEGRHGWTTFGPLRMPFALDGHELHYRAPFTSFVDIVEPMGPGSCAGRATFRGRTFATFTMTRVSASTD
jgi:hypothetical protein